MAFKEAPKVDAKELYYHTEKFIIRFLDDKVYGSYLSVAGSRCRDWRDAMLYESYDDAVDAIKDQMLEGVAITKVHY